MTIPISDESIVDAAEAAAENPATSRAHLKLLIADLVSVLVRLIVSFAYKPLTVIAQRVFADNRLRLIADIKEVICTDPEFVVELARVMNVNVAALVRAEVDHQMAARQEALMAEVAEREAALLGDIARQNLTYRENNRADVARVLRSATYPFALLFALIGTVIGGIGTWILTLSFKAGTVTDAAGQSLVATSIVAEPSFAYAITVVGALVLGSVFSCIGGCIDVVRNRRR